MLVANKVLTGHLWYLYLQKLKLSSDLLVHVVFFSTSNASNAICVFEKCAFFVHPLHMYNLVNWIQQCFVFKHLLIVHSKITKLKEKTLIF